VGIRKWIGSVVAAAAVAAPAAHAGSLDPWAYNVVLRTNAASAPLKGEHSFGQNRPVTAVQLDPWALNVVTEHTRGQYVPVRSAVVSSTPTPLAGSGGFRWAHAGIGAAVAAALMLIVGGAALGFRRAHARQASA
jgi:hypothetical protein